MLAVSLARAGRAGTATGGSQAPDAARRGGADRRGRAGGPGWVGPAGREVLNRTETPLPVLNTLSGRSSPLRSTRASLPSGVLPLKPPLAPGLPCVVAGA